MGSSGVGWGGVGTGGTGRGLSWVGRWRVLVSVAGLGCCGSGGSWRDWRGSLGSRWFAGVKVGDVGLAGQWEPNVVVLEFYLNIVRVEPWDSEDQV